MGSAVNTAEVAGVIAEAGAASAPIAVLPVGTAGVRVRPAEVVSESAAVTADAGERTLGTASGRVVHVESLIVVKSLSEAPVRLLYESVPASVSIA